QAYTIGLLGETLSQFYSWEVSDSVIAQAWRRAEACCECRRITHKHRVPCGVRLTWENRGREGRGAWEAHHIVSENAGGADTLSNCEILCWNCHSDTF
ncbi:MAG TPA: HNH endonuclease, partial [Candidatus Bathyarchaeia archaeon]|nr:HNH endonuclease [Candidatus Bathyarchaeia archaeon]